MLAEQRSPRHHSLYMCTPIKERGSKDGILLQTSAQRISGLKDKYSAKKMTNGRLTPIKPSRQATQLKQRQAEFVSKIPRLNSILEREQAE